MTKRINPRKAKIHQTYTIEEAGQLLDRSIPTIRSWIKNGLPVLRGQIPHLIIGADLREFLEAKKKAGRKPLGPDQLFCLSCKKPQVPLGGMVDYIRISDRRGRLMGICPVCDSMCNRFTTPAHLHKFATFFDISKRTHGRA